MGAPLMCLISRQCLMFCLLTWCCSVLASCCVPTNFDDIPLLSVCLSICLSVEGGVLPLCEPLLSSAVHKHFLEASTPLPQQLSSECCFSCCCLVASVSVFLCVHLRSYRGVCTWIKGCASVCARFFELLFV